MESPTQTVLATEVITEERQNEKLFTIFGQRCATEQREMPALTRSVGFGMSSCDLCCVIGTRLLLYKEELVLRLRSVSTDDGPHVTWAADVVDNEHLGRLKSNCCCIYTRPRVWDDPSTWEQDEAETEHCRGHTLPPPRKPEDHLENPKCDKEDER